MDRIPGSLVQKVFGFLDVADVSQCALVCRDWGTLAHDLDNVLYDRARADLELEAIRRRFLNDGFRESVDEAREGQLQRGFDEGFVQGVTDGLRTGEVLGMGLALALMQYRRHAPSEGGPDQQQQHVRQVFERLVELHETARPPAPSIPVNPSAARQQQQSQTTSQLAPSPGADAGGSSASAAAVPGPSRVRQTVAVDFLDGDLGQPPNAGTAALEDWENEGLFGSGPALPPPAAAIVAEPELREMDGLAIVQALARNSPDLSLQERQALLQHLRV